MKTPAGRPASAQHSAISSEAEGSFSDGLSTTALPHAIAIGTNHIGTIAGKLNGEMTATTPSGWRIEKTSTPPETPSLKPPLSRCGAPQANSATSRPRCTSPSASSSTLPCSAVIAAAISWRRRETASRNANITAVRRVSDWAAHACPASTASATTASTSSRVAKPTLAETSPVAGS